MDGRATLIRRSMILTVAVTRACLWFRPNADFNVGPYNIHHLFTGALLMSAAGIAASLDLRRPARDVCAVAFGIGLALTLDEWIYLIVTDGSNAMYWSPPSVIGAVIAIGGAWACLGARSPIRQTRGQVSDPPHRRPGPNDGGMET
jgi:hypothetical protein